MQRHDARKTGDTADEGSEIMVVPQNLDLDGLFDIKLLCQLRIQLYAGECEVAAQTGFGDIIHQVGNLGLAGQLSEQLRESLFHLNCLRLVLIKIRSHHSLLFELCPQCHLFSCPRIERCLQVSDIEPEPEPETQHEDEQCNHELHNTRPHSNRFDITEVVPVEVLQLFLQIRKCHVTPPVPGQADTAPASVRTHWQSVDPSWHLR